MVAQIAASELASQYFEPAAQGPTLQADLSAWAGLAAGGAPVSILAAGTYQSNVIQNNGFRSIGIGVKSTQAGALTIQRFLDRAGTVPIGAPVVAAGGLLANTSNWATVNDNLPFASFSFSITNTGGSTATISNFACLLSAL